MLLIVMGRKRQSTVEVTGLREGGDVRGCLLAAIMILDFKVTRCIHIWDMQNTYACTIQVVSSKLFSGSSCWSRKAWALRSHVDTLRDMRSKNTYGS